VDAERTAPAAVSSRAASRSTGDRRGPRARALAAAGSGALFAACSPPIDFLPGVFLGLALLAWSSGGSDGSETTPRAAMLRGWLFGLTANLVALRFVPGVIARFTPLPLPAQWLALLLLSAAQALPWAVGSLGARLIARRVPSVPSWLAFGLGVYVATMVPAVFPWTPAGGLAPWPALLQIADVVGERGVSLVVAVTAGLVADAFVRRARAPLGVAAAIVLGLAGYGTWRMRTVDASRAAAPHARVALVQPGFDASDRWDEGRAVMMTERLASLTRSAEARGAELVVWPESAYPYTLPHGVRRSPGGARAVLQPGVRGPVLTGAYLQGARDDGGYNAALLATRDGSFDGGALSRSYDKRHLLWFGETVPLADAFPWLRRVFARGTGLVPGHESVRFDAGRIHAAVLNCYEDTLPAAGREAMEVGPNLLVNITNDAWFAGSAEGELHLRLAVLRAIETRRDLVRAVNRGPTSFVDAAGRVRARYADELPASIPVEAALLETPATLYARFGDAPLVVLAIGAVVYARRRASAQKTAGAAPVREGRP
jgi:apolipoprotein N-acyltransferase